jgi:7-keto-8-aminopelargonate synthetase-like enzyme
MNKSFFDQVYEVVHASSEIGLGHLTTDDKGFTPAGVKFKDKEFINFSLCDYLGLSQDQRLKRGAIRAIEEFGVYTAVSRAYMKLSVYEEAEQWLSKVFGRPVVAFARTTLVHAGVMPVLVGPKDAVIIDHQAHTSMRMATEMLAGHGIYIETIRHNRIDLLEDKIKELKDKYQKIWYLADSVYSMYGDVLPYDEIQNLLNTYDQFRFYVDDAHGMSWTGKNGHGYLFSHMNYHPHMVVITSLGKGFGAGGGICICYDQEMKDRLVACAPPLIFSLPLTPATCGAIVESAKIHCSEEIGTMQAVLRNRVDYFTKTTSELGLPVINNPEVPIAFVATGRPDMCQEICRGLMDKGIYLSASHLPAVPLNNSGLRISLNLHQSFDDVKYLVASINEEYYKALAKRKLSVNDILKHYKMGKEDLHC